MKPFVKGKIINDFTKGPIFTTLVKFSLPYMLSNFLQVIYSVVDMIVVGHCIGHGGMAAVAVASRSYGFLVLLCVGLTAGAQIYLAQMIGKGERSKLGRAVGTIFTMMTIISVVSFFVMIFLSGPFLKLINTPDVIFRDAHHYMLLRTIGIFFIFGYNMFSAVLRGVGDSKHPMIFVMISAVLNLVLDIWFVPDELDIFGLLKIKGFGMGINGAAIATVIALGVKFVISAVFLYRRRAEIGFDFRWSSWCIDRDIAKGILRIAIPLGIRHVALDVSMIFVQAQVNAIGVAAMAVFVSGIRLDNTVHTLATGIYSGASGIIGQNYGARKIDRIHTTVRYTWLICAGLYAVYVALLLLFPMQLFGIFTTDKAVQDLVPVFVSAIIWHFPAATINKGTTALILGIGNAWLSFALSFSDAFVLRVLLSWLLGTILGYGLFGYILGYALAGYGVAIPGLIYYFFCPWQKRKLVTDVGG